LPAGVLLLTCGVDVQDDRIELQLQGWGRDEECWIIEQHVIRGDPGDRTLWREEVDPYLKRRYVTEDGRTLLIEAAGVDTGGHHTQAVYDYCVARKRYRIWAVKGKAGSGRLVWPKQASRVAKSKVALFIVGVDTAKSTLYGRLERVTSPGAGYIHLPDATDEEFCRQFTSEVKVRVYTRGRPVDLWKPRAQNIKQEAQDCWVYGYAAFIGRHGPLVVQRRAGRLAGVATITPRPEPPAAVAEVQSAPTVEAATPAPEAPQVAPSQADPVPASMPAAAPVKRRAPAPMRRGGWAKSWKW